MKHTYLLEIFTEELPAKQLTNVVENMKKIIETDLTVSKIPYSNLDVFSSPRRIAIVVNGLLLKLADETVKLRGPSMQSAYNANNEPTAALMGFLSSKNLSVSDCFNEEVKGVKYVFVSQHIAGQSVACVLEKLAAKWVLCAPFNKSMRWRDYSVSFARPIRAIISLFDNKIVHISIEGVSASNFTFGHRTLCNKKIVIKNASDYVKTLRKAFVIVNQNERKQMILNQIASIEKSLEVKADKPEKLVDEVLNLVEYPTAFIGEFESEFLKLPKPVVITPMKDHQRYFPLEKADGTLINKFIGIRNGDNTSINVVAKGNATVLRARLKDAEFFYKDDLNKPLSIFAESLKEVVYQRELGSIWDKVVRIGLISDYFAKELKLNSTEKQNLKKAIVLCKADLNTAMVNEFEELQGVMGKIYATHDGENIEIATAIESHYLPRFSGDMMPKDKLGLIMSLSDKIDSVVSSFAIGVKPTGTQDPFGLRRSTIAILSMLIENDLNVKLEDLFEVAYNSLGDKCKIEKKKLFDDLIAFFNQRLKIMFVDEFKKVDLVDASLSLFANVPCVAKNRIKLVLAHFESDKVKAILVSFNRISKLAKNSKDDEVLENLLTEKAEKDLFVKAKKVSNELDKLKEVGEKSLEVLSSICPIIDKFFVDIMVMCDDKKVQENRLKLCKYVSLLQYKIIDFTQIIN